MPLQNYWPQPPSSTTWLIESIGGDNRRITDVPLGQSYTTLLYDSSKVITKSNAIAEAIRRAKKYQGAPQKITAAAGIDLDAPQVGSIVAGKADGENYAFWGSSTIGPMFPIKDVYLDTDEATPARILGKLIWGSRIKGANSIIWDVGQMDGLRFYFFDRELTTQTDYFGTSPNASQGSYLDTWKGVGMYGCTHTGNQLWAGSGHDPFGRNYDCKTAYRVGFGSIDLMDCVFPTCGEHVLYGDACQESWRVLYCSNTSSFGTSEAALGRTFVQHVQRGLHPINQNNYGGLPGQGSILIQSNTTYGQGATGSSNITIAGFLGDGGVTIENHTTNRNYGGLVTFWCVANDGGFNTFGPFDPQANPNNYQPGAFVTKNAIMRGFTGNLSTPWTQPTACFKFSGVENIEIEDFSIANLNGQRVPFAFWDVGNETSLGNDPWDNGAVLFRCPPVTVPVSQYAAFAGISGNAKKARWKNSTTSFTDAQLDALANRNSAYPPGGSPPPPPNAPFYSKAREGWRGRAAVLAPTTSVYSKAREGWRGRSALVDNPYTPYAKAREGWRGRAVVVDSPTGIFAGVRSSWRATAQLQSSTSPIQGPPKPDRIYRRGAQVVRAGSAGATIARAGSANAQIVRRGAS